MERFKDHCTVISGFAFKSADLHDYDDIPIIKIGNISNGGNIDIKKETQYVSNEFLSIDKKYHINCGDILISLTGSHINQPNSMVGRSCRSYDTDTYLLNQRAGKVICNDDTNDDYMYYLLNLRAVKENIVNRAYGAANQVNVSPSDIMKIKWTFPDIIIQNRIGAILSNYDKLIFINTKCIKTLEQMAENLYKEWFVRFRFPSHEKAEFENGIPKGWEYKTAAELSSVLQRGISPDYDDEGEYTVISQKCIRTNIMDISESRRQTKAFKPELNLQDADTVICSTGTGTLGRVGRVIGSYPNTTFDSHVTLVRAKKNVSKQFLYGALKNTQTWFMNMGIGSTNQQELYISVIRKTKLLVPTDNLMKDYENIVKPIHDNIGILISDNENLIKQRDLLLPRLMSGKLKV